MDNLQTVDSVLRIKFCKWRFTNIHYDKVDSHLHFWMDEVRFYLSGYINQQKT
jgi:hypothetical protein